MAGSYYEDIILDVDGHVKCELCDTTIRDNDYLIEDHVHNTNHAKLNKIRLLMRNGITVSEDISDGPWSMAVGRSECCICDCRYDTRCLLEHIESGQHVNNIASIKEITIKDGGFMLLPENITKFGFAINCMICNCGVRFNMETLKAHIASEKHKRVRSMAVQPLNGIFSIEDNDDYLWCKICQIYFQNYVELILQHVDENPRHLDEMRKILLLIKGQNICIKNFLKNPRENGGYCKKCQTDVPCNPDNLERHIKGKLHNPANK